MKRQTKIIESTSIFWKAHDEWSQYIGKLRRIWQRLAYPELWYGENAIDGVDRRLFRYAAY